ncbi:MAG: type IV toxin-antitoxin system AbiEi family antitoxin domain-containing protein [Cocleimonas sp.]
MTTNQQLDQLLPHGMIATKKLLLSQGMALHTIDNALKSKKIQALTSGVYARVGIPVSWWDIVYSLQQTSEQSIYVGGLTAIELQGFAHYLPLSTDYTVHLYSQNKPPAWLWKVDCGTIFKWHGTKSLWNKEHSTNLKSYTLGVNVPVTLSTPERAILELLTSVPKSISFDHANEVIQGMTSLSPKKLNDLLLQCKSIKVKRLFLWLAERQNYAWFKKLEVENLNLGSGKRVIAKGGKLDKEYQITVPNNLYGK